MLSRQIGGLCLLYLVVSSQSLPCVASSGSHNAAIQLIKAGREALQKQRWGEAVRYFREAVGWEGRSAEAHVGLGLAYLHLAQLQRAGDQFHAAQKIDRNNAQAEYGLRATHTPGELESEFSQLAEQVKSHPNDVSLRARYAEDLVDRGRFDEARDEATAVLKTKPALGEANYVLGRIALHDNRPDDARKYFNLAIKADKRDDDAWGGLGDLAMQANNYAEAITAYRHASGIVPDEQQWHEKIRDACKAAGDSRGADEQQKILDNFAKSIPTPTDVK